MYLRKLTKLKENLQDLTQEEAYKATLDLLEGRLSPVKASAFLTAMRIKGETAQELLGIIRALKENALPPEQFPDALDLSVNYDGKIKTLLILPSAVLIANACGLKVGYHYADRVPVKEGITLKDIFESMGYKCVDTNLFVSIHQKEFIPKLYGILPLRRELGFRTFFNVVEKLLNPFGAKKVITSLFHKPYFDKLSLLCQELGFENWVIVKGVEGGIEPFTDRPTFFKVGKDEVRKVEPKALGLELPKNIETDDVLGASVSLNIEILEGRARREYINWAMFCASFLLLAGGLARSVKEGLELASEGYRKLWHTLCK